MTKDKSYYMEIAKSLYDMFGWGMFLHKTVAKMTLVKITLNDLRILCDMGYIERVVTYKSWNYQIIKNPYINTSIPPNRRRLIEIQKLESEISSNDVWDFDTQNKFERMMTLTNELLK